MEFVGPMAYKTCTNCAKSLDLLSYHVSVKGKYRRASVCKPCVKLEAAEKYSSNKDVYALRNKKWQQENKEKVNAKTRRYYNNNKELSKIRRAEWGKANPEKVNKIKRKSYYDKYYNDMNFKLKLTIRNRTAKLIKRRDVGESAIKAVGCDIAELKNYLESKFQPGMTWENYGTQGWHIDHIRPLSSFDLTDPEQFRQACHYTNLQPLWAKDNLKKGAKYD